METHRSRKGASKLLKTDAKDDREGDHDHVTQAEFGHVTLDVDADPEEEEEGAEAHEDGRHGRDHHLLLQLAGEFCGGHLHTDGSAIDAATRRTIVNSLLQVHLYAFLCLAKMRQI
jgi:hypothetical protein